MNRAARLEARPAQLTHADIERAVNEFAPVLPGWALFPVRGKIPPRGLAWTEAATADPVERAALAEAYAHDGWAVACGPSGLTVIDLDRHDESADGIESWCAFLDAEGMPQAAGNPHVVGTTPNGKHLYFSSASGVGNRVAVLPGVDVRGVGGYVVFSGPERMLTVHAWQFPSLPDQVRDLLSGEVGPSPAGEAVPLAGPAHAPRVVRALLGAANVVAQSREGSRNSTLNWAAYRAGREALAAGMRADAVVAILLDAAQECGLPDREALATIRSGLGLGVRP
jgi:hypothetical protein